jgi:hypothetical protein
VKNSFLLLFFLLSGCSFGSGEKGKNKDKDVPINTEELAPAAPKK